MGNDMCLKADNINVLANRKQVLKKISFQVQNNEILAILGPSGAGKTTLLKYLTGIISGTGRVILNNKIMQSLPTYQRNIGYLSQEPTLLPHLSVWENISLPLKFRKIKKATIKERVNKLVAEFNLQKITHRLPQQISGGEMQRASLARALIYKPQLLLLDEPCNSLDTKLRYDFLLFLKMIVKIYNVPTVYVTHDLSEARFISQKILFLNKGEMVFLGKKDDFFHSPNPLLQDYINKTL